MADRCFPNTMPDFVPENANTAEEEERERYGRIEIHPQGTQESLLRFLSTPYSTISLQLQCAGLDLKETRRLGADEGSSKGKRKGVQVMVKQRYKVTCKFCKEVGHNQKGCKMKKAAEEMIQMEDIAGNVPEAGQEVMTQEASEIPPMTQEEQGVSQVPVEASASNKTTTRSGRKVLKESKKRKTVGQEKGAVLAGRPPTPVGFNPHVYVGGEVMTPQAGGVVMTPATMAFRSNEFIKGPVKKAGGTSSSKNAKGMRVFTREGHKYVTRASLDRALHSSKKGKK